MSRLCAYHQKKKITHGPCRIFEISMGRTGSRSLSYAVGQLGLVYKHGPRGICSKCKQDILYKHLNGKADFDHYKTGEFSSNLPHIHWKRLFESNPSFKFVLLLRDVDQWLASKKKHGRKRRLKNANVLMSTGLISDLSHFKQLTFDETIWREGYIRHENEVKATIPSDRLLLLNIYTMDSRTIWRKLSDFLWNDLTEEQRKASIELQEQPFPHIPHIKDKEK